MRLLQAEAQDAGAEPVGKGVQQVPPRLKLLQRKQPAGSPPAEGFSESKEDQQAAKGTPESVWDRKVKEQTLSPPISRADAKPDKKKIRREVGRQLLF